MTMRIATLVAALVAAFGLAACDKPQTAKTSYKQADSKPWDGAEQAYTAKGWTVGDRASWEAQMRARNQQQNEYQRVSGS
ncbi:hypothetical protein [Caldimonas sp. KR1-144]|uniref:hypothetical protein n=1 Tax=Caldimonas sp. KR1-144 TaxID=3400911 RepID=UPI003C11FAE4